MNPALIEELITAHTKAIVPVHLYGHPANMDPILAIADRYGVAVVEDAAEAHGATYKGKRVGSLGDMSTFSFYGNKLITTGEGGMVCTNDDGLADRVRRLKGQGQDPARRYWFTMVGYNYRMTNIQAALGLAQMEKIDWHLARRREVASWYRDQLADLAQVRFSPQMPWAESVYWLSSIVLETEEADRDDVMRRMLEQGVGTRPFFYPMHILPPYVETARGVFPVADWLASHGLNLPSSALITEAEVQYVVEALKKALSS
jgi:perosamine synthetase